MRDRNGFEVLDRTDCLALIAPAGIGRVGFTARALPQILPVDYALVGDQIVFRTSPGSQLERALRDETVVAFEVDDVGRHPLETWSVVVTGRAGPCRDLLCRRAAEEALGARWAGGGRYVALSTEIVSGRRRAAA